jgi:hypothetical protein
MQSNIHKRRYKAWKLDMLKAADESFEEYRIKRELRQLGLDPEKQLFDFGSY